MAPNVNLVVDNAPAQQSGPKVKFRIHYQSPFWLIQVRNPESDIGWQDVRKPQPIVAYNDKGFPSSVFPLEHYNTYTEAHQYCETAFQGNGIEEYVKPKQSFWRKYFGSYQE